MLNWKILPEFGYLDGFQVENGTPVGYIWNHHEVAILPNKWFGKLNYKGWFWRILP
jgi:hypothetical protein